MSSHEASCDGCSYKATFTQPLRSYRLPDGTTVPVEATFVWCEACNSVRWGEKLPGLDALRSRLTAIEARDPAIVEELSFVVSKQEPLDEVIQRQIATL